MFNQTFTYFPRKKGFTLVEVLAAMVFMAIVIPAAIHGLTVASRLEVMAERKKAAAQLGGSLLSEKVATGDWRAGSQEGDVSQGSLTYHWSLQTEDWSEEPGMQLVSVKVQFDVQGRSYDVAMNTLVDGEAQ